MGEGLSRRDLAKLTGLASIVALRARRARASIRPPAPASGGTARAERPMPASASKHYTVAVIGSGFGGTMTALSVALALKDRPGSHPMMILERGPWWTTPVETVQDPQVATAAFLKDKKLPVRYWASADHFKGLVDILLRCVRRPHHEDALYGITSFGKGADGLTIVHANGVGGGSLVYANVTISLRRRRQHHSYGTGRESLADNLRSGSAHRRKNHHRASDCVMSREL